MGIYIKTATELMSLNQPITSESIKQALGYLPVNFSGDYNDLTNKPTLFSGNYEDLTNKPIDGGVWTNDSDNFYVVDENENVIALIDEKGIHSIDFDISGKSVKDHIEDKDIHISAAEREKWNDPLSSTDSELYIADDSGNILALFDANGLTITAIKTNTINGIDANDLATKTYIKEQIDAINETLNNIDSILEPVEAEIDTLQQTVTDIKAKTDNLEATESDVSLVITDNTGNAIAQIDESGLTVTAVKTNSINGTAVDEFSTKAELDTKAQELQNAITSGDTAVSNQLNTHVTNKSNPHEVTAAQVGAYTTTEADNTFAIKEHNHDDTYSKLDHTHTFENTIVSAGLNVDVSNSGLNYTVALKDNINLTSVTADEIIASQISKDDDTLVIQDDDGNTIFQVDENGITTYGIKTNEITATKLNGTEIGQFATQSYTEENFAVLGHNHDSVYSKLTHDHDTKYSDINHNHDTAYADIDHDHDEDYAAISHNHDDVYSKLDHTHDLPTVSEGTNINVTKTDLDYNVALASEIELTKVKATTVSTDILETPTVLQNGDTLAIQDNDGNTIAQFTNGGLSTTAVYINGKEVINKEELEQNYVTKETLNTIMNSIGLTVDEDNYLVLSADSIE